MNITISDHGTKDQHHGLFDPSMKILHVISSINPGGGGPIEGIRQMGGLLTLAGHAIEVACLDSSDSDHVRAFPFPIHAFGPGRSKYAYSARLAPWLRANACNYDVLVVNGIWQYHSLAVWRAVRGTSVPYVVFTHGMLDPWFKRAYPLKHLKKLLYWPWAEYRVLRDAKAVLFTTQEERRLARKSFALYRANEVVVNYGTTGPTGDRDAQTAAFFSRFPHLRGKRLVLFMGRIHPKKGCDLAIEAFARVLGHSSSWHLVMAGPNQVGWQAKLESLAKRLKLSDKITWTGMIGGDLKWGSFRASEVLFLPSHQENFGIVVAEALASGLPVLISDKVNICREVQEDTAGFVAPDDIRGACTLLERWVNQTDEASIKMREQAHKCFEKRFNIRESSSRLVRLLRQIADQVLKSKMNGQVGDVGEMETRPQSMEPKRHDL
jgi:glycosyltransferase involved in cell wall biosynthesis